MLTALTLLEGAEHVIAFCSENTSWGPGDVCRRRTNGCQLEEERASVPPAGHHPQTACRGPLRTGFQTAEFVNILLRTPGGSRQTVTVVPEQTPDLRRSSRTACLRPDTGNLGERGRCQGHWSRSVKESRPQPVGPLSAG